MGKRLTTEEFVEKAKAIHGELYDYSITEFIGTKKKLKIICKEHGIFEIAANKHIYEASGCAKCSYKKKSESSRMSYEEFERRVNSVHGSKYAIKGDTFEGATKKVVVNCRLHGDFTILGSNLLIGHGCCLCGRIKRDFSSTRTTEEFIKLSKEIHGEVFDYSATRYTKVTEKLKIICRVHGEFEQRAAEHLNGHGCARCSSISRGLAGRHTTEDFIQKAKIVHGDNYSYSSVEYSTCREPVIITCKIHGDFMQVPSDHLKGSGCHNCKESGFRTNLPAYLYVLRFGSVHKIGITNNPVQQRLLQIKKNSKINFHVVKEYYNKSGEIIYATEQRFLRLLRQMYKQPTHKFDGFTECFYDIDEGKLLNEIEAHLKGYDNGSNRRKYKFGACAPENR